MVLDFGSGASSLEEEDEFGSESGWKDEVGSESAPEDEVGSESGWKDEVGSESAPDEVESLV